MKILYILLIFLLSCHNDPPRNTASKITPATPSTTSHQQPSKTTDIRNAVVRYKIISSGKGSYGYDIYSNGKLFIHQPIRPAVAGNSGFASRSDAEKVAKLVMSKIKKGELPPGVTIEEMKRLKVIK